MTDVQPGIPQPQGAVDGEPTLRSVTLYKHGVGAFSWSATVGPDGRLILPMPAQQIDDVLKSLLVLGVDGTGVDSISYTADEPLDRQLRGFGVNLQGITGLADLLSRMVGTVVRLRRGTDTLQGQIIATEVVERQGPEAAVRDEWLLLLLEQGTIERVELAAVRGLEIIKGETAGRLAAQLDLLQAAQQPDLGRLVIRGAPGQQLSLAYVAEAPVWKMTYRVVLGAQPTDKPFLQGWAIAENTGATDWSDVELALISGMPLSFTIDLSHPRFRPRPKATIPEIEGIAPPVAESAIMAAAAPMMAMQADEFEDRALTLGAASKRMRSGRQAFNAAEIVSAPPPPTTTRSVGDLFEYRVDHPVTIPAHQAALIPVLAGPADGDAVAVYNASVHAVHPLNAVRLRNTTGLTLDAGPMTVMRDDTYVGEAMIDVIKPDEQRLVSYAVDLGCRVESQQQSKRGGLFQVRIARGTLYLGYREWATTTYRLTSLTNDQRTVVIEHPVRQGWDIPTPLPTETTASYYRYEVAVPPRQGAQLVVRDGHTLTEVVGINAANPDQLVVILGQTNQDPRIAAKLNPVIAQGRAVADRQSEVNRIQAEIDTLTQDQARLRSNLQALGQGPEERDLARRYVSELSSSEDRLAQARTRIDAARLALQEATNTFNRMIEGLGLDEVQLAESGGERP